MIKLKETAIKTMADALMAGGRDLEGTNSQAAESSEEIIFLNRKLREAFKISPNPKSAPAPHFASVKNDSDKPKNDQNPPLPTKEDFIGPKTDNAMEEKGRIIETEENGASKKVNEKNLDDLRKIKEELERQQKANELIAEEEKKRQQAKIAAELEKEKRRIAEEKAREAEREAAKKLQEEKKREEERQIAQEKLRQEKLRTQIEVERKKEERRKQLAELETEREKEKLRRAFEEKKKQEEEEKQAALKAAEKPENNPPAQSLLAALEKLAEKLRSQKTGLEKQLSAFPDISTPKRQKKISLESKISQIKSTELAAAIMDESGIENLQTAEKAKLNGKLGIDQEKIVEQKLWEIDEQRKNAEKKRWEVEDKINKVSEEIADIESQIEEGKEKETAVSNKIKTLSGQEKLVVFAQEKWKMEQEMITNVNEREMMTPALETALNKKNSIAAKMQELADRERSINNELAVVEQKEKQTSNPSERRAAEQERWQVGEKLKTAIQSKWETEERLGEEETKIQIFQGKIGNVNKKIGRIQNIISENEANLEREGLPVRRIRDEITNLFKQNGLEVDTDLLSEIIQPDDLISSRNQEPLAEEPLAKTQAPLSTAQNQIKTKATDILTDNKTGMATAKEPAKKPEPPKPTEREMAQQETAKANIIGSAPTQKSVPTADIKESPTASEPKANAPQLAPAQAPAPPKQEPILEKEPLMASAQPKAGANPNDGNIPPQTQNIAPEIIKPAVEPAVAETKKTETSTPVNMAKVETPLPGTPEPQLTPDTKLADIIKNARPDLKTERTMPGANNIPGPLTGIVAETAGPSKTLGPAYREQIAVTPATNIRSFPPEEKAANAGPAARIQRGPTEEDMQIIENADKEGLDVFGAENPAANVLDDRWGKIKKTTTPAGNTAVTAAPPPGAMPSAIAEQTDDDFAADKPSGNKTLVRVIVILVLLGIIGIAITLVLLKNNSAPPSKNSNETVKKETVKKEGGGEETPAQTKTTLAVLETKIIPIEDETSIPNVIFPYLQSPFDADGYYRLVIQNKKDKTNIGLRQFLSIFKVTAPAAFYSSASDDFTLFIYSSKGKNRLGFVTTTDNASGLKAAMTEWEPNLVTNTDNMFKFLGRKTQGATATLKFDSDATSDNAQYRTLAFSPATDNYSIAYAVYEDKYFVFSTSNEALIKIFGQLPK